MIVIILFRSPTRVWIHDENVFYFFFLAGARVCVIRGTLKVSQFFFSCQSILRRMIKKIHPFREAPHTFFRTQQEEPKCL